MDHLAAGRERERERESERVGSVCGWMEGCPVDYDSDSHFFADFVGMEGRVDGRKSWL